MADIASILFKIESQNSLMQKMIRRMGHNYFKLIKSMCIDSQPKADTQINDLIGQCPDLKFQDEF